MIFLCLLLFLPSVLGTGGPVLDGDLKSPPRYKLDLDESEETRWNSVLQHWNKTQYRQMVRNNILLELMSSEVLVLLDVVVGQLDRFLPSPYASEIKGIASFLEMEVGEVVFLNLMYEFAATSTGCTSIVAEDSAGNIWHGRNLDFHFTSTLRYATAVIDFQRGGKTLFTGTSFVGSVGIYTAQRADGFTISLNRRNQGNFVDTIIQILKALVSKGTVFTSFQIRDALSEGDNFSSAFNRLAYRSQTSPDYYIIGGTKTGEGAVITRDRLKAADIWRLDPSNGRWFVLETNYDHWLPPPKKDDRRDVANKAMKMIGQDSINLDGLLKVLSITPVCRGKTVYTTLMSAARPDLYKTFIRRCG